MSIPFRRTHLQKTRWLWPVFIVLLITGILLPISPLFRPVPSDDPSVYLYVGQTMLDGGAPYRDAWDHKPPLAFFLYALGLVLTPAALWGIWVLEAAMLSAAGVLAYLLLEKIAGPALSALSVMLGLLGLFPILWGYSIEEFSLVFQVLVLYALARYLLSARNTTRAALAFGIGAATGALFFLKQSLIAAGLAAGLYLFLDLLLCRDRRKLAHLAAVIGGFALVSALVAGYLWSRGAMASYLSAAFTFNFSYAGLGLLEQAAAVLEALEYMGSVPVLWLSIGLWLTCGAVALLQAGPTLARWVCKPAARWLLLAGGAGLVALSLLAEVASSQPGFGLAQQAAAFAGLLMVGTGLLLAPARRQRIATALTNTPVLPDTETPSGKLREALFFVAAMLFPLILLLITRSGRNYVYYFFAFTPFILLAFGLVSSLLLDLLQSSAARRVIYALLAGLGLALIYNPALLLVSGYRAQINPPLPPVIDYIQNQTGPEDTILAWGKDTTYVYFLSQRKAPGRYFYQAAIWQPGYNEQVGAARETLQAMQANPPALFLIYAGPPSADAPACPLPTAEDDNSEGAIFRFVCERYTYLQPMDEFLIFALNE